MPISSRSFMEPPFPVERALLEFGRNLRTARLRRNLTIEEVARKLGVGRHVVANAEHGKHTTGIAVYVGLLWVYDMVDQINGLADPDQDEEGRLLARAREPRRARIPSAVANDF